MLPRQVQLSLAIAALCGGRGLCSEKEAVPHASIPRDFALEMQRYAEKRLAIAERAPPRMDREVTEEVTEESKPRPDERHEKAAGASWSLPETKQALQLNDWRGTRTTEELDALAPATFSAAFNDNGAATQMQKLRRHGEELRKIAAMAGFTEHKFNRTNDGLSGVMAAVVDATFVRAFHQAMGRMQMSLLSAASRAQNKATKFARQNANATEHRTLSQLRVLLDESSQLFIDHQLEVAGVVAGLQSRLPVSAKLPVSQFLLLMDGSEIAINRSALTSQSTACLEWAKLMANATPMLADVNAMREKLDSTSRMLPMLESLAPDRSEAVVLMEEMANLGYMQAAAMKDVVDDMVGKVGPVVADRLHCTVASSNSNLLASSNSHLAGKLLMAVLAAAVAIHGELS